MIPHYSFDLSKDQIANNDVLDHQKSKRVPEKHLYIINVGEGVEKKESSYTVCGTVNCGEKYGNFLKNVESSYDPVISLLGITWRKL